eukprot:scaffold666065_cov55-Attheya_sp.AAC.1
MGQFGQGVVVDKKIILCRDLQQGNGNVGNVPIRTGVGPILVSTFIPNLGGKGPCRFIPYHVRCRNMITFPNGIRQKSPSIDTLIRQTRHLSQLFPSQQHLFPYSKIEGKGWYKFHVATINRERISQANGSLDTGGKGSRQSFFSQVFGH